MANYDEVFGAYNSQKNNTWRSRQRLYDEVFGEYAKPKDEAPEKSGGNFWDTVRNYYNTTGLGFNFLPDGTLARVGGTAAETVGNVANSVADTFGEGTWRRRLMEAIGEKAQSAADSLFDYGARQTESADNDTYLGSAWNAYTGGFNGVLGGLASMAHADKGAKAFDEAAQKTTDQNPVDPEFSWEYFFSPHGLTRSVAQTAGSMTAIVPAMAAVPESAVGAVAAVGNPIVRELIRRGAYGAAKRFSQGAPLAIQYALGSAPLEALSEGGHVRTESLEQGVDDVEATKRSLVTAAENVPVLAGSNFLEGLLFGAPFKGGSLLRGIAEGTTRAGINAGQQALEEGTQYAISANQLGKDYSLNPMEYSDEQAREFWEGFFGSLPMAGAAGAGHVASHQSQEEQDRERGSQDNLSLNEYSGRAGKTLADRYEALSRGAVRDALQERDGEQSQPYKGENGAGEGKTWFRQGNASLDGAQPNLLNAIDMLGEWLYNKTGRRLVVTSGTDGHSHADGDHSHYSGWKVDVVDEYTDGEDSDLITADFQKGKLADEFIAYGRSLGLGMNFEGAGTGNVHFDIALDGTQWDGNGEDAGGFNPSHGYSPRKGARQGGGIDTFMRAISGQESGSEEGDYDLTNPDSGATGRFQIMPENWSTWAQDAGLSPDAPMTQENQNLVARNKMLEYYNKYGNWADVASMWYSGRPTSAYTEEEYTRPQYSNGQAYPSIKEYVDSVMSRFQNLGGEESLQDRADEIFREQSAAPTSWQDYLSQRQNEAAPETETAKSLFDMSGEDEESQKLFERFANERRNTETGKDFFASMFVDDTFQNTQENRDAIRRKYPKTLAAWQEELRKTAQEKPQQQTAPKPAQPAPKQSNATDNNVNIISTGRKYLEQLNKQNDASKHLLTLQLQDAINQGRAAEVEKILQDNNIAIPEKKPAKGEGTTQSTVQNNTTPENTLPEPKAKPTATEKLIARARAQIKLGLANKAKRVKQGAAISTLAAQNNITIPQEELDALYKGKTTTVQKWRDALMSAGVLNAPATQQTQTQSKQPQPAKQTSTQAQPQRTRVDELQEEEDLAYQDAIDQARENWDTIKTNALKRGVEARFQQAAQEQEEQKRRETSKSAERQARMDEKARQQAEESKRRYDEIVKEETERERQIEEQKNEEQRQAKQNRELEELQARQIEERRLAGVRREQDAQNAAERKLQATAFSEPTESKQANEGIGSAILQLMNANRFEEAANQIRTAPGLVTGLRQGSKKAIEKAQGILFGISEETPGKRANEVNAAQAEEQVRVTQETARQKAAEQSRQASEQAQSESARNIAEDVQRQRQREAVAEAPTQAKQEAEDETTGEPTADKKEDLPNAPKKSETESPRVDVEAPVKQDAPESNSKEPAVGTVQVDVESKQVQPEEVPAQQESTERKVDKAEQPVEESAEDEDVIDGTYGKKATATSQSKTKYPVRYKAVEADDLFASHELTDSGVYENPEYVTLGGIQPRERTSSELQQRLSQQARDFDSDFALEQGLSVNVGAAVIRKDGVVFNGNGRVAVISYLYDAESPKADEYKNRLIEDAGDFGLNADEIAEMGRPVLVRELQGKITEDMLEDIAGTFEGGAAIVADAQAFRDAKKIRNQTLRRHLPENGTQDWGSAAAKDFAYEVIKDIATQDEMVSLLENGKVTDAGIARVQKAIFARAYPDKNLVKTISNHSSDDTTKNMTNALKSTAGEFAEVRAGMEDGAMNEHNLNDITDAVIEISNLRKRGKPVKEYLESIKLGEQDSEAKREAVIAFDKFARSGKKTTQFLQNVAAAIKEQGRSEDSLFGEEEEPQRLEGIIRTARKSVERGEAPSLFSHTGEASTSTRSIVEGKDLTPAQKLLRTFGEKLGVKTVFFDNPDSRFHGVFKNDTIYLNVNSQKPLGKVFWHESLHWLNANNPKLYTALTEAAGITDAQRDAYIEKTKRTDLESNDAIDEEILCDAMEDTAKRTGLLQSIAGKNRGLIERVVQWLKDTMGKFVDHFRNPQGKLTTKQAQAMADEFGRIARSLTDQSGQKIFRYNNRTGNIELADGRDLSVVTAHRDTTRQSPQNVQRAKYSIGNDNSGESLKQKMKNIASVVWSGKPTSKARHDQIIRDALKRVTGCRIAFGHTHADETIIDDVHKIIRSPHGNDFENLIPKISGKIAQGLNLTPNEEMNNYIADWILTGAINNTSQQATDFQKAMRDNPAEAEAMQTLRNTFQEFIDMTAEERVGAGTIHRTDLKPKVHIKRDFQEQVTDDLHPLERAYNEIVAKAKPEIAEWLKDHVSFYEMARLARGTGEVANQMINAEAKDVEKLRNSLRQLFPNVKVDRFRSLKMTVDSVGGDEEGLNRFAIAKLDKEIHEWNRANPGKKQKVTMYDEATDDEVIKNGEKKFGDAHKALVAFSNIMLWIQFDSGLITQEAFSRIRRNGFKNYVPLSRVFEDNEQYDDSDPFARRTGSKRLIKDSLETIALNAQKTMYRAESNRFKLNLATVARCGEFGEIFSEIDKPSPNDGTVIRFMENGKRKYLQTPDLSIVRAAESVYQRSDGAWIMKLFRAAMGVVRGFRTVWNPSFAAGNIFRDMPDSFIHNQYLYDEKKGVIASGLSAQINLVKQIVKAFANNKGLERFVPHDQDAMDWRMFGGAQSGFVSEDIDYAERTLQNLRSESRKQRYFHHGVKGFLQAATSDLQRMSEFTEEFTRINIYKQALAELAKRHADGKPTADDKRRAALVSRDAAVDFAKAGTSTRKVNQVAMFANAAVQGIALDCKTFNPRKLMTKEGRRQWFAAAFRLALTGIVPALLQSALNDTDDDRYKKYKNCLNWEKDTYWILGDGIRIPKGMDLGLRLVSTLTEELWGKLRHDKPVEYNRFATAIVNAAPSMMMTLITPILENEANYSFFRQAPIVPVREQKLLPEDQYGAETSSIAKIFGRVLGYSPRKIDNLISGYLNYPDKIFSGKWQEFPVVRRFIFDPYKNPKIVQDYYEAYATQEKIAATYKARLERGDRLRSPKDVSEDYDPALHKRLKAAQDTMRKLSAQERKIIEDESLSSSQRTERLHELERRRTALCEKIFR